MPSKFCEPHRSRQLTALIEDTLGQFRQSELDLLGERQQRANRDTVVATLIAAVMAVLAMLSSAVGAFLLRNQRSASQLRVANEELAISHAHLQSILETVPDAMVVIDERGTIQSFPRNRGAPLRIHHWRGPRTERQHANADTLPS